MFGRDELAVAIAAQVSQRRFVSIVGAGGIGKTTIALAIADAVGASCRDGCAFLDLAPLNDSRLVPSALAMILGIGANTENLLPTLVAFLRDKDMLIVLDSCEHLIEAAAVFAEDLLKGAPGVRVLATSREPLRAAGEIVRRLPPLDVPPADDALTAARAQSYSAVQLFVECATSRNDAFALTDHDAPLVADICRRLDGNALAIELAAGRVHAFGVAGVAARLIDRFQLLTAGRRTALPRHQTLIAMLDWSYDLLPAVEQATLRRLSVFAGDFGLDAATAVAADAEPATSRVVDAIANLTAKSLVSVEVRDGRAAHYRLLDTTAAYARQKLTEAGEVDDVALRHARYYRGLLEHAGRVSAEQTSVEWRAAHIGHLDNVRVALDWALSPRGNVPVGITLTIASVPLWLSLSLMDECRKRVIQALSHTGAGDGVTARQEMQLQTALGVALYSVGPGRESSVAWTEVMQLADRLEDVDYQLRARWGLWTVCVTGGGHRAGLTMAIELDRVAEAAQDPEGILVGQRLIGTSRHFLGEQAAARHHLEGMLRRAPRVGNPLDILRFQFDQSVAARAFLGRTLWLQGLADSAMHAVARSVADAQSIGHSLSLCYALGQGACPVALLVGDLEAAERYVSLLLDHAARHGLALWATMGRCFEGMIAVRRGGQAAGIATDRGRDQRTAQRGLRALSHGFAGRIRRSAGT